MVISEITEEKPEEPNDHDEGDYDYFISPEAQRERIRNILEHQKSLYRSSSTSSSSSTSCSCSFSSSRRSRRSSLLELMRGGSTSLRRLFDMEHTSLADHFEDYSGGPVTKPVPLWGSDSDVEEPCRDQWAFIREAGGWEKESSRSSGDKQREAARSRERAESKRGRGSNRRLTRKRSFRKLPGNGPWRWRWRWSGFRFGFRLRRSLRIMICGRKF